MHRTHTGKSLKSFNSQKRLFSPEWTFMDIYGHLMTPFWAVPPPIGSYKIAWLSFQTQNTAPVRERQTTIHLARADAGARGELRNCRGNG